MSNAFHRGVSRPALAGVPLDLYRLGRRFRQARRGEVLGQPRHDRDIYLGRFPIPPERVLVLSSRPNVNPAVVDGYRDRLRLSLPTPKVHGVIDLMSRIAAHYDAERFTDPWTVGLLRREYLGTCGIGRSFALIHQFQSRLPVTLLQPPVDWWLILYPDGIEWDSLDSQPVFAMFAHVFANVEKPGLMLRAYEKSCRLAREIDWPSLAKRPVVEITPMINRRLLELTV